MADFRLGGKQLKPVAPLPTYLNHSESKFPESKCQNFQSRLQLARLPTSRLPTRLWSNICQINCPSPIKQPVASGMNSRRSAAGSNSLNSVGVRCSDCNLTTSPMTPQSLRMYRIKVNYKTKNVYRLEGAGKAAVLPVHFRCIFYVHIVIRVVES